MRKLQDSNRIIDITRKEQLPLEVLQIDVNKDKSIFNISKINEENKRFDVLVDNA